MVYSDGQPANTNSITSGLDTWAVDSSADAVPLSFVMAAQTDANGAITDGLRGSLSIARLRVYDQTLGAQAIAQIYAAESGQFAVSTITIESVAYMLPPTRSL